MPPPTTLIPRTSVAVLLYLSAVDALATVLSFRSQNCIELNPAMRWLLEQGEVPFVFAKIALTGFALLWICKRWSGIRSRLALLAGHSIYVPIVLIHIVTRVVPGGHC